MKIRFGGCLTGTNRAEIQTTGAFPRWIGAAAAEDACYFAEADHVVGNLAETIGQASLDKGRDGFAAHAEAIIAEAVVARDVEFAAGAV